MPRDYKQFFAICKHYGWDYKDKVAEFTDGRTESLSSLSDGEYHQLLTQVQRFNPSPQQGFNEERKKMRGKITHYLCLLGYVDPQGKPDWNRIDRYIVNIGSRNPRKVILNYLYTDELKKVLTQVETMYKKELNK